MKPINRLETSPERRAPGRQQRDTARRHILEALILAYEPSTGLSSSDPGRPDIGRYASHHDSAGDNMYARLVEAAHVLSLVTPDFRPSNNPGADVIEREVARHANILLVLTERGSSSEEPFIPTDSHLSHFITKACAEQA